MTRAEMKLLARQLIQETLGAATEGDIFTLDAFLTIVTDEIASRGDLYYAPAAPITVTAGTIRYAAPALHHVTSATVVGASGVVRMLTTIDPGRMDRLYGGGWRNAAQANIDDATAVPVAYAVLEGTATVRLWPPPIATLTNGLQLEGFGAPGGSWAQETDTCPLPVWTHKAVAYSLAVERCVQYADSTSDRRVQRLNARAEILLQDVLAQAGRFVQGAGAGKQTGPDGLRTVRVNAPLPPINGGVRVGESEGSNGGNG